MTAIEINDNFDFTVENLMWVNKADINPIKRVFVSDLKTAHIPVKQNVNIKKDERAIVQLRKNGEFIRRYYDISEVLEVHPTWKSGDVLMCLTGHFPDAYGYRFMYEYEYEKK